MSGDALVGSVEDEYWSWSLVWFDMATYAETWRMLRCNLSAWLISCEL